MSPGTVQTTRFHGARRGRRAVVVRVTEPEDLRGRLQQRTRRHSNPVSPVGYEARVGSDHLSSLQVARTSPSPRLSTPQRILGYMERRTRSSKSFLSSPR